MNADFFMWSMLVMFTVSWILFVFLFFINRAEHGIVSPLLLVLILVAMISMVGFAHVRSPYHPGGFIFPPSMTHYVLAFSGVCAALCLFFLKQTNQAVYGLVEIIVAGAVLLITAQGLGVNTLATNTVGFVSGIYVLVRGITNVSEYLGQGRNR